jgi:hypothetical protein
MKIAGSGSISQRYGSGSESVPKCHGFPTLIMAGKFGSVPLSRVLHCCDFLQDFHIFEQ